MDPKITKELYDSFQDVSLIWRDSYFESQKEKKQRNNLKSALTNRLSTMRQTRI